MQGEQFYKKHRRLFKTYEYAYDRYKRGFSIALVKLNDELIGYDINFKSLVRYSDRYVKIDDQYHFFIFLEADVKKAFQAILNLEKNLISKYNLYNVSHIFQSAVVGKDKYESTKEMLRKCFELIKECKEDCTIATEDKFL